MSRIARNLDYYVDGLTSTQLEELRETISTIKLPDVLTALHYNRWAL